MSVLPRQVRRRLAIVALTVAISAACKQLLNHLPIAARGGGVERGCPEKLFGVGLGAVTQQQLDQRDIPARHR